LLLSEVKLLQEVHMPFILKNGVYSVRCRFPHCTFNSSFPIEQTIMGLTEGDVDGEAFKIARDTALSRHDSLHGRRHTLQNPEVRRVSGVCQRLGGSAPSGSGAAAAAETRVFGKGEVILRRGEAATKVCEVMSGHAYPEKNPAHQYAPGDCFGAAALVSGHRRLMNVISGADGTRVSFYDLAALSRNDPGKARRIFTQVVEDVLSVVQELQRRTNRGHHRARGGATAGQKGFRTR
jgi:hypothetical protein